VQERICSRAALNHGDRASERKRSLRDVNLVLREKERELAILKKQVEALKVAAALLEEPTHFEPGNTIPEEQENNRWP